MSANDNKGMISLDPKLIDNLVKEHIFTAVASSLAENKDAVIRSLIDTCINLKVDESGNVNSYGSSNKFSWLEITFNQAVRGVVKQAIIEQITAMKPEIEKAVKKEMLKSGPAVARAIMSGFTESIKYDWNFKVGISGDEKR